MKEFTLSLAKSWIDMVFFFMCQLPHGLGYFVYMCVWVPRIWPTKNVRPMNRTSFVSWIFLSSYSYCCFFFFVCVCLLQVDSSFIWVLWSLPFACIMFEDYLAWRIWVKNRCICWYCSVMFLFGPFLCCSLSLPSYSHSFCSHYIQWVDENNALKMDCAICFLVFLFSFVGYYIRMEEQKNKKKQNLFTATQFDSTLYEMAIFTRHTTVYEKSWKVFHFFCPFTHKSKLTQLVEHKNWTL